MKRRFRRKLILLFLAAGIGPAAAADFTPLPQLERVMVTVPKAIPDLELTGDDGKPFKLSSMQGRPTLVFFGYAHCPDVCPAAMQKLMLLRKTAPAEFRDVRVVMISVDGERDTPASMRAFLDPFSPEFIGLTGPSSDVRTLASSFAATFFKDPPKDSSGAYLVQHTSRLYALDRKGRLRAEMYDASLEATGRVLHALLAER